MSLGSSTKLQTSFIHDKVDHFSYRFSPASLDDVSSFIVKFGYNACCHWLKEINIWPRSKLALCPSISQTSLLLFFANWKWNFGTSEPGSSKRRTKQRFVNMRRNWRYYNASTDKKAQEKMKRTVQVLKVFTLGSIISLR